MAHPNQIMWFEELREKYKLFFNNVRVLDVGSMDINGNNRYLFTNSEYIGLDVSEGKNVDVICPCHEYNAKKWSFDTIISTNQLEHDMFMEKSLKHMYDLLKPGGMMFISAAHGWGEHGTRASSPDMSGTSSISGWEDYYKNVNIKDFERIFDLNGNKNLFSYYEVYVSRRDVRFLGRKRDMLICTACSKIYKDLLNIDNDKNIDKKILEGMKTLSLKCLIMGKYYVDTLVSYKSIHDPNFDWDQKKLIISTEEEERKSLENLRFSSSEAVAIPDKYENMDIEEMEGDGYYLDEMYKELYKMSLMLSSSLDLEKLKNNIKQAFLMSRSICNKVRFYESTYSKLELQHWKKKGIGIRRYKINETGFIQLLFLKLLLNKKKLHKHLKHQSLNW